MGEWEIHPSLERGLWAEDEHVACATTGTGEFILRGALASELKHYVQRGLSIEDAGDATIEALRSRFGPGRAGLIGVDPTGRHHHSIRHSGYGTSLVARGRIDDYRSRLARRRRLNRASTNTVNQSQNDREPMTVGTIVQALDTRKRIGHIDDWRLVFVDKCSPWALCEKVADTMGSSMG